MAAQRVLVVDDSPTIRKVVGGVLVRAGYEVGQAGDGLQALGMLRKERWDLALVDFVMPRLNGFELCRKLREDDALRALPVVLMSVKADRIREHFLRQTGAVDAITKPFDPRALILAIEGAIQKAAAGRGLREPSGDPHDPEITPTGVPDSGAPEPFVRRLADVVARVTPHVRGTSGAIDPVQAAVALRRALGDDGLLALHSELTGGARGAVLAGDLSAIPLAEVLQLLQLQRQSGILAVSSERARGGTTEVLIAMREGLVDLATSKGSADEFRLGRYVVEMERLDRAGLEAFLLRERERARTPEQARERGQGRLLGDALVAEGILRSNELQDLLARQTSELIYDVLRWTRGRFHFAHRATRSEANAAQLGLPVATIVMEGFRRVDEWRLMEGVLGDFDAVFYSDPGAVEAMGTSRLTREERAVLYAIDGTRSVREIIGAVSMSSFDVCKVLYQFVQSRLVRRRTS
jgi:CheY-like chemotaxis protein